MDQMVPLNTMIMTTTILSVLVLLLSLTKTSTQYSLSQEKTVMLSFMLSMIPTVISMKYSPTSLTVNLNLLQASTLTLTTTTTTSVNSNLFLSIALFITWAIMQFSSWYMKESPNSTVFKKYLTLFLIAMLILILSNSMIQLFIGWEGVGIMSFLLINWWYARTNANSSAMQAISYNRIGDIGIILALAWLATNQATWTMQLTDPKTSSKLLALGLILAAAGKSAQFLMHLWLPSAMEGPTPVSALLHSSTMVVAGVYLLIQMYPIMQNSKPAMDLCLYLGTITSLCASMAALSQNDLKKIIALSTLSQLGLMMMAIGNYSPQMALFHISTHASTKAALFLCAGSFIHNLHNEQDIRKMGNMKSMLPITSACLTTASLTLMGVPFLSCFYSKDPIIEIALTSKTNMWLLIMALSATAMTSSYSVRMIYYTMTKSTRNKPLNPFKEVPNQIAPILRLAALSIFMGSILTSMTTQMSSEPALPKMMKLAPLIAMLLGIKIMIELQNVAMKPKPSSQLHTITNQLAFFKINHRWTPKNSMKTGTMIATQLLDLAWTEKSGPTLLTLLNKAASKFMSSQMGLMKLYLSTTATTTLLAMVTTHYAYAG